VTPSPATRTFMDSRVVVVVLALLPAAFYAIMLLSADTVVALTREDGIVQDVGAALFLVTGVAFLLAFAKRPSVFTLLLGLLFLFGFLEEISYGQRVFGFATPQYFLEHNVQQEFNLHNMEWFERTDEVGEGFLDKMVSIDRLFSLFWLGYCVAVPVICRFSAGATRLANKIRLPIVPLVIAALFILNYLVGKGFETARPTLAADVTEIKETVFAYLFAWFAVAEYVAAAAAKRTARAGAGATGADRARA
jgi:hypothetical protein